MFKKKSGQRLYDRAKKIIPGGNMMLSKRPEMFLPDQWPSYFSKTQGCYVWDLDMNKYIDATIMSIGTNSLGYNHKEVDESVMRIIKAGNLSTLNCPEEVKLAEKLLIINPWADMVKLARTGGEANSISIRIARAASGKDNVAICGYHGWHDWYLSANHNNTGEDLSEHLLPGLNPKGVPRSLGDTVYPFEYNDFDGLKRLVENHNIGVIKMEVVRNHNPKNDFLKKVRDLATKKNIVLIFDECTSGFRETFGGIHQKFNVDPDIIMFGKTLGNGYAISAIVGRREIMEFAQETFISSTFWTERIGPTAALKTLEVMEREKSWNIITERGLLMKNGWKKIAKKYNIPISIYGIHALGTYQINHKDFFKFKTYLTQHFLNNGFLASNGFYPSISHSEKIIKEYLIILEEVFAIIKDCIDDKTNIDNIIKGPIAHNGFKRLN